MTYVFSTSPLDDILPEANAINHHISFTLELSTNSNLPFLDACANVEDNVVKTSFYSKQLHSGHLLPWDSHVPLRRKINLLKTECMRIHRNCSSSKEISEGIRLIESLRQQRLSLSFHQQVSTL